MRLKSRKEIKEERGREGKIKGGSRGDPLSSDFTSSSFTDWH